MLTIFFNAFNSGCVLSTSTNQGLLVFILMDFLGFISFLVCWRNLWTKIFLVTCWEVFFSSHALYFLTHLMSLGHCYEQLRLLTCLCYLEDACRVQFIPISPFIHTVNKLWFLLVETNPNSIAFFKDSRSRLNGIYFNSTRKNPCTGGVQTTSRWGENFKSARSTI